MVVAIGYALLHLGLIKIPAARAVDCKQISNSKVIEVRLNEHGFEPKQVEAGVCDTLVIINTGPDGVWPAVGPHPTHTSYPGFDAKRSIPPGDRFEFILNRPGSYTFHDHNHEELVGNITIAPK